VIFRLVVSLRAQRGNLYRSLVSGLRKLKTKNWRKEKREERREKREKAMKKFASLKANFNLH